MVLGLSIISSACTGSFACTITSDEDLGTRRVKGMGWLNDSGKQQISQISPLSLIIKDLLQLQLIDLLVESEETMNAG